MFKDRLRERIKSKNIKQQDLAGALNLSKSTISLYVKGRRTPETETLKKLAAYLGTTTSYLLGEIDDPNQGKEGMVLITEDEMGVLPPDAIRSIRDYVAFVKSQQREG